MHPCILDDGEPWFKTIDVATALKYTRTNHAIRMHVADVDKRRQGLSTRTSRATGLKCNWRNVIYINKSGLHALVAESQAIEAASIAQKSGMKVDTKYLRR